MEKPKTVTEAVQAQYHKEFPDKLKAFKVAKLVSMATLYELQSICNHSWAAVRPHDTTECVVCGVLFADQAHREALAHKGKLYRKLLEEFG